MINIGKELKKKTGNITKGNKKIQKLALL